MLPAAARFVSDIPGVEMEQMAMYAAIVGPTPSLYCPPGCTLEASGDGTIYLLDHVRRAGHVLMSSRETKGTATHHAATKLKRERAPSNTSSTSSINGEEEVIKQNGGASPTLLLWEDLLPSTDNDLGAQKDFDPSAPTDSVAPLHDPSPEEYVWLPSELLSSLPVPDRGSATLYCHFCRTYFSASDANLKSHVVKAMHISNREKIRHFLLMYKVGLSTKTEGPSSKIPGWVIDEPGTLAVPKNLLHLFPRVEFGSAVHETPFTEHTSLLRSEHLPLLSLRKKTDGREESVQHPFSTSENTRLNASRDGNAFLMEGVDLVAPYCKYCRVPLMPKDHCSHGSSPAHRAAVKVQKSPQA